MFLNRTHGGSQLAEKLHIYKNSDSIVLAIPRGGVPVGKVVAEELGLPLEMIISKKISHPLHKEFAIGAVSMETRVLNDDAEVSQEYIESETTRIREMLRQRFQWYYKNNKSFPITNKTVILIDDGVATGYTLLSALELIHQHRPKQVIVATPVAPPSAVSLLESSPYVDEVVCLFSPNSFRSVGQFYVNFEQVSDKEVVEAFLDIH